MSETVRTCAVLPCYNEARFVGDVVRAVRDHVSTVWVVDDASTDATGHVAASAGARVIRIDSNGGKGHAASTGLAAAIASRFERAVLLDGDGQHSPAEIPALLKCASLTGADLVIGNRMADPAGMPLVRRWVNRLMSRDLSRWTGAPLPDTQCGFRVVNLAMWERARVRALRFEFESDMLVAFLSIGARVEFAPISVRYSTETSKIHPLRDTLRWLAWRAAARRRFRAARPQSLEQSPCPAPAARNILAAK